MSISCTILTKNSAKTIKATLEALKDFDEVVILDSGSTDETLEIAKSYLNTVIYCSQFLGFGYMHNLATSKAKNDWILSIDSDEVLTDELKKRILSLNLDPNCVYSFAFQNILFGKKIRHSGWYPDRHVRLYHRKRTAFTESKVHERILVDGLKEIKLKEKIEHYSYLHVSDFLRKLQIYTDLFQEQNPDKTASFSKAVFHGFFAFIKTYFIKLGILDGKRGFIIAFYQAQTAFYKYLKLWEKSQK